MSVVELPCNVPNTPTVSACKERCVSIKPSPGHPTLIHGLLPSLIQGLLTSLMLALAFPHECMQALLPSLMLALNDPPANMVLFHIHVDGKL